MGFYNEHAYKNTYGFFVRPKLLMHFGVPESTIYNGISKHKWDYRLWDTQDFSDKPSDITWIEYITVPSLLFKKYNLPNASEIQVIIKKERAEERRITFNKNVRFIKMNFEVRLSNWRDHISLYSKILLNDLDIEKHCRTHVIFEACLSLRSEKYKIKELYGAYKGLDNLVFKAKSQYSFANKLRIVRDADSLEDAIIHGLRNKQSNAYRITNDVDQLILRYFNNPKSLNAEHILELVNDYLSQQNRRTISKSYVYNLISNEGIKSEALLKRHGMSYAENNLFPHSFFSAPQKVGQLWCMDATRCQFIYKTQKKKSNFLFMFVIIDAMSKKVIGYSFGKNETTQLVINALSMACNRTMYLPKYILHDNSSALSSNVMNEIKAKTKLMGVNWRSIRVGNSRDNGIVERFFGVFQEKYCKPVDGYLGDGITSTNINGKPSPEEFQKFRRETKIRTREDLEDVIASLFIKYNSHCDKKMIKMLGDKEYSITDYARKLNTLAIIQLFWDYKEITIQKSTVIFQLKNQQFMYIVYDEKFMCNYRNKKVIVRYNQKNMDEVFLFSLKGIFIKKVKRYEPVPKLEEHRTIEENRRLSYHNKMVKDLKDKMRTRYEELISETDMYLDNLPLQITNYSMTSKKEREKAEDEYYSNKLQLQTKSENSIKNDEQNVLHNLDDLYSEKGNLKIV